jgi:hypothetical protein
MLISAISNAQTTKKGMFYFGFGSHRAFYSPSTVRFVSQAGPSFDFTLEHLKARDDGGVKFHTSPQYSYNIGYYSYKRRFGIEYQFDHVKYTMVQGQVARMRGHIGEVEFNTDTIVHAGLVKLEHTDGANYAMLNFVKWKNILASKDMERSLDFFIKAGAGLVIPKTNSTILGKHYDDQYAISGYVAGVEPGLRYNFLKNFFVSASFKGAFANYRKFRIAEGYGSQSWFSAQFNLMAGIQLPH